MDHIVVAVAAVFFAADLEVDNIEVTSSNIAAGVSFGQCRTFIQAHKIDFVAFEAVGHILFVVAEVVAVFVVVCISHQDHTAIHSADACCLMQVAFVFEDLTSDLLVILYLYIVPRFITC